MRGSTEWQLGQKWLHQWFLGWFQRKNLAFKASKWWCSCLPNWTIQNQAWKLPKKPIYDLLGKGSYKKINTHAKQNKVAVSILLSRRNEQLRKLPANEMIIAPVFWSRKMWRLTMFWHQLFSLFQQSAKSTESTWTLYFIILNSFFITAKYIFWGPCWMHPKLWLMSITAKQWGVVLVCISFHAWTRTHRLIL